MTHAGKGTRLYGGRQKGGKTHGKGEATAGTKHTVTGMVPCGRGNGIKRSQRGCVQTRKGNKLGRCNFQGGEKRGAGPLTVTLPPSYVRRSPTDLAPGRRPEAHSKGDGSVVVRFCRGCQGREANTVEAMRRGALGLR